MALKFKNPLIFQAGTGFTIDPNNTEIFGKVSPSQAITFAIGQDVAVDSDVVFTEGVQYIPVLDAKKHLVGVATNKESGFIISGRSVGVDAPVFVIAEACDNHLGSMELAQEMASRAKVAGANAVKFQLY